MGRVLYKEASMSMLARYRKPGGFEQLLSLIETRDSKKRDQLLKVIEQESPNTAECLRQKMLTIERVFSWDTLELKVIISEVPEKVLALACHGLGSEAREIVRGNLMRVQVDEFDSYFDGVKPPQGQIEAAFIHIVQKVREMDKKGAIALDQIEPDLTTRDIKVA
jgi:flagellar motor switch protein FliG